MKWFEAVAVARKQGVFTGKIPKKGTDGYNMIKKIQEGKTKGKKEKK